MDCGGGPDEYGLGEYSRFGEYPRLGEEYSRFGADPRSGEESRYPSDGVRRPGTDPSITRRAGGIPEPRERQSSPPRSMGSERRGSAERTSPRASPWPVSAPAG